MRQLYKDIVIGFILASFVYSPVAFAKPQSARVKRASTKSKKPLYLGLEKAVKTSKRGMKISTFVNASKPMVKKREFRDIKKGFMPFWDKKFDKMVVGSDYFVVGFKGQKAFGRFVDRGPIAFIINGKPLLWKDVMMYGRLKSRLFDIMGLNRSKNRKVSLQEYIFDQIFPKAFGVTEDICRDKDLSFVPAADGKEATCLCPAGKIFKYGAGCQPDPDFQPPSCTSKPGTVLNDQRTECTCANGRVWNSEDRCEVDVVPVDPDNPGDKKDNKWGLILFGAVALLILFLLLKKKKKKVTPVDPEDPTDPEDPPTPGWTPEPEGQCPTPGARGMTEADLPPECRKSTCNDTNSCTDTGTDGMIY